MPGKAFSILFVDDEEQNLVTFKATFRRDYTIYTANSALEGLEVMREHNINLVITDQRMPEMTGVEFLETILPEYPDTIRILLTGYSDIDAVIDAINTGRVFRYITKPWDERELRMTIENARQFYGLQQENIKSQFEVLKNQVNPHFLFNSLNVLSSLIYIDKDAAAKFVRQLSKVYRYVLEYKDKETVSLHNELDFLESYIFLLKTRFAKNLVINTSIHPKYNQKRIVPMALQLLMENAIKHNVISKKKPLKIDISVNENDYLVITNNLQKKSSVEMSSNIGIKSINKRYEYITDDKVIINKTEGDFTVKLPLVNP